MTTRRASLFAASKRKSRERSVPETGIDIGAGWVARQAASAGTVNSRERLREYPAKVAGQHRWVVLMLYTVSEEAISSGRVVTDRENLCEVDVHCVDCGERRSDVADEPCTADRS